MRFRKVNIALILALIFSCTENEQIIPQKEKGILQLNLGIQLDIESSNARMTDVDINQFQVSILDDQGNQIKKFNQFQDVPEQFKLAEGNYRVVAQDGNPSISFNNPYYYGETTFSLVSGETKNVEVQCKLANCKVSVLFSENIKNNFKNYFAEVINEDGQLKFTKDETRTGYFSLKPIEVSVNLVLQDVTGNEIPYQLSGAIPDPQPATMYRIMVDKSINNVGIQLVVNEEEQVKDVIINDDTELSDPEKLIELINQKRISEGLSALTVDQGLNQAAQDHSDDMALNDFFDNTGSDGSTLADRIARYHDNVSLAGQSKALLASTAQEVADLLFNSAADLGLILEEDFDSIGASKSLNEDEYWVIVYALIDD